MFKLSLFSFTTAAILLGYYHVATPGAPPMQYTVQWDI